jgi:hypothetical protein
MQQSTWFRKMIASCTGVLLAAGAVLSVVGAFPVPAAAAVTVDYDVEADTHSAEVTFELSDSAYFITAVELDNGQRSNNERIAITGLTPDRQYTYRATVTYELLVLTPYDSSGSTMPAPQYANVTVTFRTLSQPGPEAVTGDVNEITAYSAEIEITTYDSGDYDIVERGVVYSGSRQSESDLQAGRSGCSTQDVFGTTGDATVMLTDLDRNTTYYVRAYAVDSRGNYGYGGIESFKTKSSGNLPVVETRSVVSVSGNAVEVDIDVTDDGGYAIVERGIVYSRTDNNPKVDARSCLTEEDTQNTTGRATITLTGLSASATYYVRAYAENSRGTAYGEVVLVDLNDVTVSTYTAKNVTANSAVVEGYVSRDINSSVRERGIVYATSTAPTTSDYYVTATTTSYGDFSVTLTSLAANQKYYARAYIRTSSGYSYGNTVSFTTTGSSLTIVYQLLSGQQVGTQTISATKGQVITAANLSIPAGYRLVTPGYSYTATGAAVVVAVPVMSAALGSAPYMEGSSNYRFEPDRQATRIEIAKMVYALQGQPAATAAQTFTDISADFIEKAALDYVTSMRYMVGYPDGTFRPYNPITRAEVAVICNAVYRYTPAAALASFTDVRSHWAAQAVATASQAGAIHGYPDGTFKPDNNISRAEACALYANAEKRTLTPLGTVPFVDVPSSHWAYTYIMNAAVPQP